MKKPILACAVLLGAAMGLQATPAQPCSNYTNYGELNPGPSSLSCTIGDKTFSDFTYGNSAVNAIPVPDSAVSMAIAPSVDGIGFSFTLALTAPAADSTNDISFGYTVSGPDITDAAVTMAGAAPLPGSSADIGETICPAGGPCQPMVVYLINGAPPVLKDSITFGPTSTVTVMKGLNVVGPGGSLTTFTDIVSQGNSVPEPGFYGLLAGGIGAIIMLARRRKKSI